MRWPSKDIGDPSNLLIRVIVVGYQKKGESCIFLLRDKRTDEILFSMVIDSYKRRKQNRTLELLKENGVKEKSLDILCWSHPDDDHSLGIDRILDEYGGPQTKVITPISFWSKDYNIKAFRPNTRELRFLDHLIDLNKKTKSTLLPKSCSEGGCDLVYQRNFVFGLDQMSFKVFVLSPIVERLKGMIDDGQQIERNQTSVTLLVDIDGNRFLFSADLPNDEIDLINEEVIEQPLFLKIPHHGSNSSDRILDYISANANLLACTTVYRSTKPGSERPHPAVMGKYIKRCEKVYNTGSNATYNFGTVIADYDIFGAKECIISTEGSAFEIIAP